MGKRNSKKQKKDYFYFLESRFVGMNQRFDQSSYMMLAANAVCAMMYWLAKGVAADVDNEAGIIFLTVILGVSVFAGIIYIISAWLRNTKKTFPVAFFALFFSFVLIWNTISVNLAIRDLESLIEWIPLLIFAGGVIAWYIYTALRLRKEIRGEKVKELEIPFWVFYALLISLAPMLTYLGRRNLGNWLPEFVFVWYWAYLTSLLDLVMARFLFESFLFLRERLRMR